MSARTRDVLQQLPLDALPQWLSQRREVHELHQKAKELRDAEYARQRRQYMQARDRQARYIYMAMAVIFIILVAMTIFITHLYLTAAQP